MPFVPVRETIPTGSNLSSFAMFRMTKGARTPLKFAFAMHSDADISGFQSLFVEHDFFSPMYGASKRYLASVLVLNTEEQLAKICDTERWPEYVDTVVPMSFSAAQMRALLTIVDTNAADVIEALEDPTLTDENRAELMRGFYAPVELDADGLPITFDGNVVGTVFTATPGDKTYTFNVSARSKVPAGTYAWFAGELADVAERASTRAQEGQQRAAEAGATDDAF